MGSLAYINGQKRMKAIEALGVTKTFEDGFTALDAVDLAAEAGTFLTLLGPSGCGKTTLLKTFAGFYPPTRGRVMLGGIDVTSAPPERRDTAMCFQSYALFPHLTVSENIEFGPKQNGVEKDERFKRLSDLLRQVDLEANKDKLPNKLSGGQQQRVALARALAMRPSVVLFDEPLSNLDAKLREQVRREIRALQKQLGFTAIYVTHDQAEALAMSDHVVVMRNGRIDQAGTPEQVYNNPETAFVADFIGAANLLPFEHDGNGGVATPLGHLHVGAIPPADSTYLVWRPEDAQPCASDAENAISAQVGERAYQGAYTEMHIEVSGAPHQRLHLANGEDVSGESLTFQIPADRLRFVRGERV